MITPNNILVYTVVFNNYDSIKPVKISWRRFASYTLVTDDVRLTNGEVYRGWNVFKVDIASTPAAINRLYKMKPWLLGDYSESLYIDASIFIKSIKVFTINKDTDIRLYAHQTRKTVKEEFSYLQTLELSTKREFNLRNWPSDLLENCLNEDRLFLGGIIYRKHTFKVIQAMKDWWEYYEKGITRDQISLPYVLTKNEISVSIVKNINEYLFLFPHRKKKSIYSGLLDICSGNRNMILFFINVILPIRRFIK